MKCPQCRASDMIQQKGVLVMCLRCGIGIDEQELVAAGALRTPATWVLIGLIDCSTVTR